MKTIQLIDFPSYMDEVCVIGQLELVEVIKSEVDVVNGNPRWTYYILLVISGKKYEFDFSSDDSDLMTAFVGDLGGFMGSDRTYFDCSLSIYFDGAK